MYPFESHEFAKSFLLSRLKINGVLLELFDYGFLLHLSFETFQRRLKAFVVFHLNISHANHLFTGKVL